MSAKVGRQLQLHRGIFPICVSQSEVDLAERPEAAVESAKQLGWCKTGDRVVVVHALPNTVGLVDNTCLNVATVV